MSMHAKEIDKLIAFHEDALAQHRLFMGPSAVYLEEQTIKALKELKEVPSNGNRQSPG